MANKKTNRSSTNKTSRSGKASGGSSQSFQTEIIMLILFGAAVLMVISNMGLGGFVGNAISTWLFGAMGLFAYIFPILMFFLSVFILANRGNRLLFKKVFSIFILSLVICGFLQHFTEGYIKSMTLADYYARCSDYKTGGGVVGGMICISTTSAFGVIGSYLILALVAIICMIEITQRSFWGYIHRVYATIRRAIRRSRANYRASKPERDKKRELRDLERARRIQERREAKIADLERAIREEEENDTEEEEVFQIPEVGPGNPSRKQRGEGSVKPANKTPEKKRFTFFSGEMDDDEFAEDEFADDEFEEDTLEEEAFEEDEDFGNLTFLKPRSAKKPAGKESSRIAKKRGRADRRSAEDPDGELSEIRTERKKVRDKKKSPERIPQVQQEFYDYDEEDEDDGAFEDWDILHTEEEVPARRSPQKNPKSSKEEIASGIADIQTEIEGKAEVPVPKYHYPPIRLLARGNGKKKGESREEIEETARKLEETLHNFGVNVTVTNVSCGPTVTQYELKPEMGVKVNKIVSLADDIKLSLATADIRIEAPIPGKSAVGIEVPNKENSMVFLRDLLTSGEFQNASSTLSFAVGKDITGKPVVTDIAKMPHLLIAGSTGSGKSVCINTLILSILYKASPDEVKLIMIDPKVVELSVYNGIPHLLIPVVTDAKKASGALNWAVQEMTRRYNTFAEFHVRKLEEYNHKVESMSIPDGEERPALMPRIVVIVDELADLMMVAPGEVEDAIVRLTQLARAAGIHLVIATQRPSVNVITGLIKANMPSRIAFAVNSGIDSRVILDMNGAEKLLGRGDMLFYPQGYSKPARVQGAFISDEEVSSVVEFLSSKNPVVTYNSKVEEQVNTASAVQMPGGSDDRDVYFEEAGRFIIEKDKASIGMLQRMFKIGFNRAARIMDQLCDAGVVGPEEGTKPRKVLMSEVEFESYLEEH